MIKLVFQRAFLQLLSDKFNFEIWNLHSTENHESGLLVFKSFIQNYKFCRKFLHPSLEPLSHVFTNCWYEDFNGKFATTLLKDIVSELNEDCIDQIAERLDVVCLADFLSIHRSSRLTRIAQRRFSNLIINSSSVGNRFGLMNLNYVLHVFADIIISVTVSMRSFRGGLQQKGNLMLKYGILHCCIASPTPNLISITLQDFGSGLDTENIHPKFQPLISLLEQKNVSLNTE